VGAAAAALLLMMLFLVKWWSCCLLDCTQLCQPDLFDKGQSCICQIGVLTACGAEGCHRRMRDTVLQLMHEHVLCFVVLHCASAACLQVAE
jgi:hypothetical protein